MQLWKDGADEYRLGPQDGKLIYELPLNLYSYYILSGLVYV